MDAVDSSISGKFMVIFICKVWEHDKILHLDAEKIFKSRREKRGKISQNQDVVLACCHLSFQVQFMLLMLLECNRS